MHTRDYVSIVKLRKSRASYRVPVSIIYGRPRATI